MRASIREGSSACICRQATDAEMSTQSAIGPIGPLPQPTTRGPKGVTTTPRGHAPTPEEAHPEAASRGTEVERDRLPPDLLRSVFRERPVAQCQLGTLALQPRCERVADPPLSRG